VFQTVGSSFFALVGIIVMIVTSYIVVFMILLVLLRVNALSYLLGLNVNALRPLTVISILIIVLVLSFTGARRYQHGMDYKGLKVGYNRTVSVDFLKAATNIVCEFLFAGPRLLFVALDYLQKALRLYRIDLDAASSLLIWLTLKGTKATVAEIRSAFPELNILRILPQLRDIPGVIWLVSQRGVIILAGDFKSELRAVLGESPPYVDFEADEPFRSPPLDEQDLDTREVLSWYEELGLPPFASSDDVKKSYRRFAKRYHPDAAAGTSANEKALAEEKMKRINYAYHSIVERSKRTCRTQSG